MVLGCAGCPFQFKALVGSFRKEVALVLMRLSKAVDIPLVRRVFGRTTHVALAVVALQCFLPPWRCFDIVL